MANPLLLYLFNEAASGTTPTLIHDTSTGTPVNCTITYGASGQWTSIGAGDGLNYAATASSLSGSLSGTKVQTALTGVTALTVELVIDSAQPGGDSYDSFLKLADGSDTGLVGVTINHGQGGLIFSAGEGAFPNDASIRCTLPTSGVYVLHVVVDSSQATAADRVKVYVNGVLQSITIIDQLGLNTTLDTGLNWSTSVLTLGGAGASPQGKSYYGALYASALSAGVVAANATALAANNDQNPNASPTAAVAWWRA